MCIINTKDTTIEEAKHMIAAIDSITTIEYRFITITVFLKNLTQDKKGKWFKDIFVHNIQNIINRDNKMLDYWPEPLARDVKRIKERETAIRQMLRC